MTAVARFITLEGGEGVGKTSNIEFVASELERRGFDVEVTREPGGTPVGEALRDVLLNAGENELVNAKTELLLMFAARSQHLAGRIRPAIAAGKWVVCDRFTDASFAYQGGGRGLPDTFIQMLADQIHADFWPGLTLFLDAPIAVGRARAHNRGAPDRIEGENAEFFERVRNAYLRRAEQEPKRIRRIDANQPLEAVQTAIGEVLTSYVDRMDAITSSAGSGKP